MSKTCYSSKHVIAIIVRLRSHRDDRCGVYAERREDIIATRRNWRFPAKRAAYTRIGSCVYTKILYGMHVLCMVHITLLGSHCSFVAETPYSHRGTHFACVLCCRFVRAQSGKRSGRHCPGWNERKIVRNCVCLCLCESAQSERNRSSNAK